jgi:hypothetical protein
VPDFGRMFLMLKYLYLADRPIITVSEDNKDPTIQAYTDGSKGEQEVGSGAAIFIGTKIATEIKLRLDNR